VGGGTSLLAEVAGPVFGMPKVGVSSQQLRTTLAGLLRCGTPPIRCTEGVSDLQRNCNEYCGARKLDRAEAGSLIENVPAENPEAEARKKPCSPPLSEALNR